MDAIVTAGGIPLPEEPLYPETRGHNKALLDISGKPMVQWVLDALSNATTIDNVILVGLTDKSGLTCRKPLYFVSNQGRMLDNFRAGVHRSQELGGGHKHVLFVASDIPAINSQMVDWVVKTAMKTDDDIYYNVIERKVMEKRFPQSKRTYTALKGMEVCGGDMNVARAKMVMAKDENSMWEKISNSRKSPLKQAALIGFDTLFLLIFGQLTLEKAAEKITKKLGVTGQVILCPYAEVGMDIDKPHQLDLIRKDFKRRLHKPSPAAKKPAKPVKKGAAKKTAKPVKKTAVPAKKNAKPVKKASAPAKKNTKPAGKPVKKPVKTAKK
jgi:GTP:adenosylcobinamide-phosphate guanylyltransferase